jgi:hypothetical protein
MLSRSDSMNYVTSCHQSESCVLKAPLAQVWEGLKEFDKVLTSHVKSVKFLNGSFTEIGSLFEVEYLDGAAWTFRVTEVSEKRRTWSYDLISANSEVGFTSMETTIHLHRVTEDDSTFLTWETDFSNDVNTHVLQDQKFKKLDYFKDLKKAFTK